MVLPAHKRTIVLSVIESGNRSVRHFASLGRLIRVERSGWRGGEGRGGEESGEEGEGRGGEGRERKEEGEGRGRGGEGRGGKGRERKERGEEGEGRGGEGREGRGRGGEGRGGQSRSTVPQPEAGSPVEISHKAALPSLPLERTYCSQGLAHKGPALCVYAEQLNIHKHHTPTLPFLDIRTDDT